jgi:hypothetical protein
VTNNIQGPAAARGAATLSVTLARLCAVGAMVSTKSLILYTRPGHPHPARTHAHTRLNQNVSHKPSHPTAMYSCTARPQLTQSRTLCDSAVSTPSCRRHPAGLLSNTDSRPRLDLLPHIAALQLGQQPLTVRGPTPAAVTNTLSDCRHRPVAGCGVKHCLPAARLHPRAAPGSRNAPRARSATTRHSRTQARTAAAAAAAAAA